MPLASTIARREYKAAYYQLNKEKISAKGRGSRRETNRKYYLANKEKRTFLTKRWHKENPERARLIGRRHKAKKYGTTIEHFELYCKLIDHKCEICGAFSRTLHIDHDHSTNTFRGALCGHCNRGLGMYRDNPARLRKAAEYLESKCSGR